MSLAKDNAEWICRNQIAPNIYGLKAVALQEVLERLKRSESAHDAMLARLRALREELRGEAIDGRWLASFDEILKENDTSSPAGSQG